MSEITAAEIRTPEEEAREQQARLNRDIIVNTIKRKLTNLRDKKTKIKIEVFRDDIQAWQEAACLLEADGFQILFGPSEWKIMMDDFSADILYTVLIVSWDEKMDIPSLKNEEAYYVTIGMQSEGGSFVRALAKAIRLADPQNLAKIKNTWPEYWEKYKGIGEKLLNEEKME